MGAAMADTPRVRVTVCYIRDRRDSIFGIDAKAALAGVDYLEVLERNSFDWRIWGQLRDLVRERRIDLLHAHDYKTNLLALLLSRSCRIPALSTAHGWTGHSPRERVIYYPLDKRILARFPRVVAVSSEIAGELARHGADARRVTVVLNAIDHRQFKRDLTRVGAARAAFGLRDGEFAIGAVGRLEPQKRFDLLLESFATHHRERPTARLLIAGDGSLRGALEAQRMRLGLAEACQLVGHVTDVVPIHLALDLFVQSSDYEGTPNSVLEAMAMETPIVATDAGGTAELVHNGEHGRIVKCNDLEALTGAIRVAVGDATGTSRMVANARRRVEGELSFESRVRRVECIYLEMCGRA
jgi:glycosyltransferase involved in cell wall biosynthesis